MGFQDLERENVLAMLTSFRQHQENGRRSPHKPLLMLLVLGQLATELHQRPLSPRPGTPTPASAHIEWHTREVFKGNPLPA